MSAKTEAVVYKNKKKSFKQIMKRDAALYLMALPGILIVFLFNYLPMWGILMSFQYYVPVKGIWDSDWVGLQHFIKFFQDPYCFRLIRNTVVLGVYSLIWGFPASIIFALLINELKDGKFKKIIQTISYMPHFISTVIVIGIMNELFSLNGVINQAIMALGGDQITFLMRPETFRSMYIGTGIWQGVGYGSILYLAAISGINPELYESAILDGASRFQQMRYITLPGIAPTISIQLIFAVSGILGNDMQKILLMADEGSYATADVISTYTYRNGLLGGQYSYSSSIGLLMSVIGFVFLFATNKIVDKMGQETLF